MRLCKRNGTSTPDFLGPADGAGDGSAGELLEEGRIELDFARYPSSQKPVARFWHVLVLAPSVP
jgi:hypothetical protein